MKRVLTFLAIMLLPLSVMAMTPVTDSDLADVTGQAGVNINADLTMNIGIGTMAWGDSDGLATGGHPAWGTSVNGYGYVGVTSFYISNLRIKARETDTFNGYIPYYDDDSDPATPAISHLKPITIDVATDPAGILYGGQTFVRFGLGSLEISMAQMDLGVELGPDTGLGQVMGYAHIGPMAVYINPISYVDIYAQTDCGVGMTMNIVVDQFSLSYMSWEDRDGQANMGIGAMPWMSTGFQAAGFIGLEDLVVGGPISITGTVYIDVTTSSAGIYSHGVVGLTTGAAPVSVVHISFPDLFNVNVAGPITANVKLDSVAALNSGNAGTLGDIYLTGFNLDILAGSWVDIWAH